MVKANLIWNRPSTQFYYILSPWWVLLYSEAREPVTSAAASDSGQPSWLCRCNLIVRVYLCHCWFFLCPSPPTPSTMSPPSVRQSQDSVGTLDFCWASGVRSHILCHIINAGIRLWLFVGRCRGKHLCLGPDWDRAWQPGCALSWLEPEALRPQGILFGFGGKPLKVKRICPWICISLCLVMSFQRQ